MQPQTPLLFHGFSLVWTLLIALFKNGIFHDIKLSGFIKSIEFCSVQLHVHLQMEIYECYSFYLIFFDTSTYYIPFLPFLGCIYVCMVNFAYYVLNLVLFSNIIYTPRHCGELLQTRFLHNFLCCFLTFIWKNWKKLTITIIWRANFFHCWNYTRHRLDRRNITSKLSSLSQAL